MNGLNANTAVSISVLIAVVSAALWLNNTLVKLDSRVANLERKDGETWGYVNMYKWTVHLQQANQQVPNFKVPEPQYEPEPKKQNE